MNVAIDCRIFTAPRRSGVLVYTERLVEHLSKIDPTSRYDLIMTGLRVKPEDYPLAIGSNFKKIVLPILDRDFPGKNLFWNRGLLPAYFTLRKIDLFHLPAGYIIPKGIWTKKIITIHDLRGLYPIPGDVPQDVESLRRSSHQADLIITVSSFTKDDLVNHFGVPEEEVIVTHLGVEATNRMIKTPKVLEEVRQRFARGQPYFLSLGLVPRKNIERLILAYDSSKYKNDFKLVLAGHLTDSWWCRRYREIIQEKHLEEHVLITGAVSAEDLVLLYNAAYAFIFPSLCEGFGLPVLEAMACGAPVITSNITALPEVAGDAAHYVDPYDVESIKAGMEALIENEDLRLQLINRAPSQLEHFSWEKMARQVHTAYKSLV